MRTTCKKPEQPKIRYKVCEGCGQRTDMKLLYRVRGRDICESCGQRDIAEWNGFVREADSSL